MAEPWKRVEQIGNATLYLGDSREILPVVGSGDVVVTDPPYGISFKYSSYEDSEAAFLISVAALRGMPLALLQYPEEMMRLVVPVLGAPSETLTWIYGSNLPRQTRMWGFWNCDVDPARSKQLARNPEAAKVKSLIVAGYDWREIQQVKHASADKTAHPCQLPIDVALWVLECVTGETVCDPFMGSGTTGVACVKLGRRFIGIEIDEGYFNIACKRIRDAVAQPDFFIESAPKPEQTTMFEGAAI
jgi:site-specific DNA-methyltransferase (adenine-specific)